MDFKTASVIGGISSGVASIGASIARSAAYDVERINAKTNAKIAALQGKADVLSLKRQFNKSMASNAVIGAAQGRRGGSVAQIASAAESQFNWDANFVKMQADMQESGFNAQAEQLKIASDSALVGGTLKSISSTATNIGTSLYSIGKSTKKEES